MAQSKQYSRRDVLKWTGVGATGALLAACTPQQVIVTQEVEVTREVEVPVEVEKTVEVETEVQVEVTAAPEARTVQVFWANWGELYNSLMTNIGTNYTADNPNVTVEWTFNDEWKEKLLTTIAAGTPPDVTYTNWTAQANLAQQGAFLPLDAYMVLTGLKGGDFLTGMYAQSLWDGKLFCVPGGSDFIAMCWSKDALADAGLDPEAPAVTTDELVEQSLQLLQVDDAGTIQRIGYSPDGWHMKYWSFIFGGEWYDSAAQKITADHPGNIAALEWIKSYVDELDIDQLAAFNSSMPGLYSPGNAFSVKRQAFHLDGFWVYDALDQYSPDIDYGVMFIPTLEGTEAERKSYVNEGWMVGIPAGAPQPEGAWDFIKYGFVDNAWKMGCDTLNGNCVIEQMPQFEECVKEKLGAENRMTPYFNVFAQIGLAGEKYWPVIPVNALLSDEMVRAYDFVVRGEKTAEEALQEVTATVQPELDNAMAG